MVHFPTLFFNKTVFQKNELSFFDQVAIDAKSVTTFEKHPLVAELKLKTVKIAHFVTFSISALPSDDIFQMSTHFLHLCIYMATWSKKIHSNF